VGDGQDDDLCCLDAVNGMEREAPERNLMDVGWRDQRKPLWCRTDPGYRSIELQKVIRPKSCNLAFVERHLIQVLGNGSPVEAIVHLTTQRKSALAA